MPVLAADQESDSHFLSHTEQLVSPAGNPGLRYYLARDAASRLADYDKLMVDDLEVFLSPESPYRGIKPANLSIITSAFRAQVIDALSGDYQIVEEAGEGVLYLRLALVDLKVLKKRVRLLKYTAIGLVVTAGRDVVQSDYQRVVRQLSLLGLQVEGQLLDSQSGEVLGEFINDRSMHSEAQSWKDLLQRMHAYGEQLACMMNNSRLQQLKWQQCFPQDQGAAENKP